MHNTSVADPRLDVGRAQIHINIILDVSIEYLNGIVANLAIKFKIIKYIATF